MASVGTHLQVAQLALHVADAPLLSNDPAQPPLPQLWGVPHMAAEGVQGQPAGLPLHVALTPLLLNEPLQLPASQTWLLGQVKPGVLALGIHVQPRRLAALQVARLPTTVPAHSVVSHEAGFVGQTTGAADVVLDVVLDCRVEVVEDLVLVVVLWRLVVVVELTTTGTKTDEGKAKNGTGPFCWGYRAGQSSRPLLLKKETELAFAELLDSQSLVEAAMPRLM